MVFTTLLLFLLVSQQVSGNTLLSRGRPTSQSSDYLGKYGLSHNAVDGNYARHWAAKRGGACTHSKYNKNNWWTVDIRSSSHMMAGVSAVVIFNRADCCQSRIGGAKVYVGDVFCGEVVYIPGVYRFIVLCHGNVGPTVTIVQDYEWLTLCEVEVYGEYTSKVPLVNVAEQKPTMLSARSSYNGVSSRAVDGRLSGLYTANSCTHSHDAQFNSWMVDLGVAYVVDRVVVHNRKDCCGSRLDGAKVLVDGALCGVVKVVNNYLVYPVKCNLRGRWVTVTKTGAYLTLCEVEVLARANQPAVGEMYCGQSKLAVSTTPVPRRIPPIYRIVGGTDANERQYPWQVIIRSKQHSQDFCGGTLIDHQTIVTAAHCIVLDLSVVECTRSSCTWRQPEDLTIVLGVTDKARTAGVKVGVHAIYVPSGFKKASNHFQSDLAILKLDGFVDFTNTIQPACLPDKNLVIKRNQPLTITGFGTTSEGGFTSIILQTATVPFVPLSECNTQLGGLVQGNMFCAGYVGGRIDACQGDSGGPIGLEVDKRFTLLGVTSWGIGCARKEKPGVYTDLIKLLGFVEAYQNDEIAPVIEKRKANLCGVPIPSRSPVSSISSSTALDVQFLVEADSTKSTWAWDVLLISVFDIVSSTRLTVSSPFDSGSVYYAAPERYGGYHVRNAFNPNTNALWGGRKSANSGTFYLGGTITCERGTQILLELDQRGTSSPHSVSSEHKVYVKIRDEGSPGGWYVIGKPVFEDSSQKKLSAKFCCQ